MYVADALSSPLRKPAVIGLTIAVGQAKVLGAGLRFSSPAGGGALAELDLGAAVVPGRGSDGS
ncbi:hypothetical protein [Streptomyces flavofungini]|uniref:Uncharacterized protein n=1 Tax=Streptomyces flavofungini TaxID=68200 RepID=A0ABS0X0A6_9ACTN|nr:hypothetical protein [Streptomyces flavofungini]GHC61715.1 hypothetical protein GCM10010349_31730 [Streptomyces flavofungini]